MRGSDLVRGMELEGWGPSLERGVVGVVGQGWGWCEGGGCATSKGWGGLGRPKDLNGGVGEWEGGLGKGRGALEVGKKYGE